MKTLNSPCEFISSLFIVPPYPWPPLGWRLGDEVSYEHLRVTLLGLDVNWLGQQCLMVETRARLPLVLPIFPQPTAMDHRPKGWDAFLSPAAHAIQVSRVKCRRLGLLIGSAGATAFYLSHRFL